MLRKGFLDPDKSESQNKKFSKLCPAPHARVPVPHRLISSESVSASLHDPVFPPNGFAITICSPSTLWTPNLLQLDHWKILRLQKSTIYEDPLVIFLLIYHRWRIQQRSRGLNYFVSGLLVVGEGTGIQRVWLIIQHTPRDCLGRNQDWRIRFLGIRRRGEICRCWKGDHELNAWYRETAMYQETAQNRIILGKLHRCIWLDRTFPLLRTEKTIPVLSISS